MPRYSGASGSCLRVRVAILILGLGHFLASPSFAQNENETTGFSSTHVFEGGYFGENLDTLNGNLTLTIPIGPSYQVNKNLNYRLNLQYNSRVWEFKDTSGLASRSYLWGESPLGLGFTLSFGRLYRDWVLPLSGGLEEQWYFVTPDGNKHDMRELDSGPRPTNDTTYFVPTVVRDEAQQITKILITNGTGVRYTLGRQVVIPGGPCQDCLWRECPPSRNSSFI